MTELERGKTIQIYLPTGSHKEIRIAEITTRVVQAIVVPRTLLKQSKELLENMVGVYFLFGPDSEMGNSQMYVGESENVYKRLHEHHNSVDKEFFEEAVVFITTNQNSQFTKSDIKYLENVAYNKNKRIGRYYSTQGNTQNAKVPKWRKHHLDEIFECMEVLLGFLGYPIFTPLPNQMEDVKDDHKDDEDLKGIELSFSGNKGYHAVGIYDGVKEIQVLRGSTIALDITDEYESHRYGAYRRELIDAGIIQEENGKLTFQQDYVFKSTSTAASVICGSRVSGPGASWKTKEGKTINELNLEQNEDSENILNMKI